MDNDVILAAKAVISKRSKMELDEKLYSLEKKISDKIISLEAKIDQLLARNG